MLCRVKVSFVLCVMICIWIRWMELLLIWKKLLLMLIVGCFSMFF